jgi:hypothetical protein
LDEKKDWEKPKSSLLSAVVEPGTLHGLFVSSEKEFDSFGVSKESGNTLPLS